MRNFPTTAAFGTAVLFWISAAGLPAAEPGGKAIIPEEKAGLFDGKGFTGWSFVSSEEGGPAGAIWSVKAGVIACSGKPNGYARTLRNYRDYKLELEWRFPEGPGNSGLFLHLSGDDKVWATCLEVQLLSGNAGEVRCNGGSRVGELGDPSSIAVPRRQAGSEKSVGAWNRCEIVCKGDTMSVTINGVLQNEVSGASVSSGAIGLQAEGTPVEFRNLVIAPLH